MFGEPSSSISLCVETFLIRRIEPLQRLRDFAVDVRNGIPDAFALITRFVAVAKFDRFTRTGGCAARHCGTADGPVAESNFRFERRITARVQDFPSVDFYDFVMSIRCLFDESDRNL